MGSSELLFPKKFPLRWLLIITTHDHHTTTTTITATIMPQTMSQYLAKNFVVVAHAPVCSTIHPPLHSLSYIIIRHAQFFLLALDYLLSIFWGTSVIFYLHRSFLYTEHYIDNEWKDVSAEGSRVLDCTYICNVWPTRWRILIMSCHFGTCRPPLACLLRTFCNDLIHDN